MTTQSQLEDQLPEGMLDGAEKASALLRKPETLISDKALKQVIERYPGNECVLNAVVDRGPKSTSILLQLFDAIIPNGILEKITYLYAGNEIVKSDFRKWSKFAHRGC